jgi:hypothetical protein
VKPSNPREPSGAEVFERIDETAAADAHMRALENATPADIERRLADGGLLLAAEKLRKPAYTPEIVPLRRARTRAPLAVGLALAAAFALGIGIVLRGIEGEHPIVSRSPDAAGAPAQLDASSESRREEP